VSRRYLLQRLAQVVPAVLGILTLAFVIVHTAPGDPLLALAGEHGDAAYYAFMRAKFGLDRPLPEQFLRYLGHTMRGDLGSSFVHGRPVLHILAERLPATVLLMVTALALSTVGGVLLGLVAGRGGRWGVDVAIRAATVLGHVLPSFWLAQLAALTLGVGTGWFPVQGLTDARGNFTGWRHALDVAHHLALPALVLATGEVALLTRLVRSAVRQELRADYVRAARARGLPEGAVVRHALRNTLLPVVTVVGGRIGMLFTGAVLVEAVFAWPGLGQLLLSSIQTRDLPVLLGMFVLVSVTVIVANLVTDLAYTRLDPRVRFG
jgi:peptide/nickel transport system permease protein